MQRIQPKYGEMAPCALWEAALLIVNMHFLGRIDDRFPHCHVTRTQRLTVTFCSTLFAPPSCKVETTVDSQCKRSFLDL